MMRWRVEARVCGSISAFDRDVAVCMWVAAAIMMDGSNGKVQGKLCGWVRFDAWVFHLVIAVVKSSSLRACPLPELLGWK